MAPTVNWLTRVVTIPLADLTLISGTTYEYDVGTTLKADLKLIEGSEEGIPKDDIHSHVPVTTLSGVNYAKFIVIINGYTITFEDGQYGVNLIGANHNIADVLNRNQVSAVVQNSAGLIEVASSDLTQVLADIADVLTRLNADEELLADGTWNTHVSGTGTLLQTKQFLEDTLAGTMSLKE